MVTAGIGGRQEVRLGAESGGYRLSVTGLDVKW